MNETILRNPNQDALGVDQLRRFSPAIFAKEPHEKVSERYGFIPTYTVLEHMHKAGFVPVEVRNYMRRDPARMRTTKHLIRFRKAGAVGKLLVGDVIPQVVLLNSHDRSSRFHLYGGLFRLVCSNGLIVATSHSVQPVVVRHTTHLAEEVVATSELLVKQHGRILEHVNVMRKHKLTERQALQFAAKALTLRSPSAGMIEPAALLAERRAEDKGLDLWHVFNRVQENLTQGGLHGVTATGRHVRTTVVNSINTDVRMNAGLWELAMAAISKASVSSKHEVESKRKPRVLEHA